MNRSPMKRGTSTLKRTPMARGTSTLKTTKPMKQSRAPSKTVAEKSWLNRVADLGCVVCRNLGYGPTPAEIHHIRTGQGGAQRASHFDVLPLCPSHHRSGGHGIAFHDGRETWEAIYGTELDLLAQVKKELTP